MPFCGLESLNIKCKTNWRILLLAGNNLAVLQLPTYPDVNYQSIPTNNSTCISVSCTTLLILGGIHIYIQAAIYIFPEYEPRCRYGNELQRSPLFKEMCYTPVTLCFFICHRMWLRSGQLLGLVPLGAYGATHSDNITYVCMCFMTTEVTLVTQDKHGLKGHVTW